MAGFIFRINNCEATPILEESDLQFLVVRIPVAFKNALPKVKFDCSVDFELKDNQITFKEPEKVQAKSEAIFADAESRN